MIIYLLGMSLLNSIYSVTIKAIQKNYIKNNLHSVFFNLILSSFQVLLLLILPPYYNYQYSKQTIVFGMLFGILFLVGYLFLIIAFSKGPLSLTNLISNLNMIVPIVLGMFVWGETISLKQFFGIVLIIFSIILISNTSYREQDVKKKIDYRWLIIAICSSLFTGLAITTSKHHAVIRPNNPKEFLIIYNLSTAAITAVISSYYKFNKKKDYSFKGKFFLYTFLAAAILVVSNNLYMSVVAKIESILFFPIIKAGNIIFVLLASNIFFKEKLGKSALLGIGIGILSIFLLSI